MRAGTPLRVGRVTLLPIERVVVLAGTGAGTAWFSASKEPVALVVRDEDGVHAIGLGAMAVSIEALRERIPGLDDGLGA
jgi:uncharacterized spore protein YtfJ